jgi:hypothetical protein
MPNKVHQARLASFLERYEDLETGPINLLDDAIDMSRELAALWDIIEDANPAAIDRLPKVAFFGIRTRVLWPLWESHVVSARARRGCPLEIPGASPISAFTAVREHVELAVRLSRSAFAALGLPWKTNELRPSCPPEKTATLSRALRKAFSQPIPPDDEALAFALEQEKHLCRRQRDWDRRLEDLEVAYQVERLRGLADHAARPRELNLITSEEMSILRVLADASGKLLHQDQINDELADNKMWISTPTLRKYLGQLEGARLILRPKGERKGYGLTVKGQAIVNPSN